jgi:hypothetical protein
LAVLWFPLLEVPVAVDPVEDCPPSPDVTPAPDEFPDKFPEGVAEEKPTESSTSWLLFFGFFFFSATAFDFLFEGLVAGVPELPGSSAVETALPDVPFSLAAWSLEDWSFEDWSF